MANDAMNTGGRSGIPWRIIGWGTAALLLLLPMVAMRFTSEVNWSAGDFIFAAVLIGTVGLAFELAVRKGNGTYRLAAGLALASAFLIVWANGAVGMIGSEDNPYNLLFGGVLAIALIGAIAARFEPAGMGLAMMAAGVAHLAVAAFGLSADMRGGIISMAMAGLWLMSAALFQKSAGQR